jgi:hypothetical protein
MLVCAAMLALVCAAPTVADAGPGGPKGPKTPKANVKAGTPKAPKTTTAKAGGAAPKVHANAGKSGSAPGKATAPGQVKQGPILTGDSPEVSPVVAPNVPKNPKLQARLQAMLPPGMTLEEAAAGYRNQGQFVASLHVANNLGIPFEDLKFQMVDQQASLGQAIQTLKPQADATMEVQRAETQTRRDLDQ